MKKIPEPIAIIGTSLPGGGAVLCNQLRRFLQFHGYQVDFYDGNLYHLKEVRNREGNSKLEKTGLLGQVIKKITEQLNQRKYPVVIAVERQDIFLENLPPSTRRFYFCQAPFAHERYYGWLYNSDPQAEEKFKQALAIERSICESADVVTFAWNTYETFSREHVYNGNNIVTHPGLGWYGCEPNRTRTKYPDIPKVVYLGHIDYWSNPELLAELTEVSPLPIHCYGRNHFRFPGLDHFGFVKDEWETIKDYTYGLNTVSKDPLRQAGFSSKVLTYLSVGLPTFSPEWQIFSHQLTGVVPFSRENFTDFIFQYLDKDSWQNLSDRAYQQAQDLNWNKVLSPLLKLIIE